MTNSMSVIHATASAIPVKSGVADLILTSPPYDNLREYNGYTFDFVKIASEIYRTLAPGGVLVWVVGDQTDETGETGTSFRQVLHFKSLGLRLHDTMIYMKAGPSHPSMDKYYQVFEYMFILSKGRPKTYNPIQDRKNRWYKKKFSKVRTRRKPDGTLNRQVWDDEEGNEYGTRFNIWQYAVGAGNHGDALAHKHPASFPEDLAGDHILSWSNPGDLVLDPMVGSGTTGKMARLLGRKFIGLDISHEYCHLAMQRLGLKTNLGGLPMFVGA